MDICILGYKGGVGKTTTAVHLATYLNRTAPTLLVDGDPNRSATVWSRKEQLPVTVADELMAAQYMRETRYEHMVVDTKARPSEDEIASITRFSDLIIVPSTPDAMSVSALMLTIGALHNLGITKYKVLLTIVPPKPNRDGEQAIAALSKADVPMFQTVIRRYVAFQRAAMNGVPVYDIDDPNALQAWQDYEAIGKEITNG